MSQSSPQLNPLQIPASLPKPGRPSDGGWSGTHMILNDKSGLKKDWRDNEREK